MGQVLVFDADDTLWENSIYFERVVDDVIGWLVGHSGSTHVFTDLLTHF